MANQDRIWKSTANDLSRLSPRLFAQARLLPAADLRYLLAMRREQHRLGLFRRVYPHRANAALYGDFLAHTGAPQGRRALHKIASAVEARRVRRCRSLGKECSARAEAVTEEDKLDLAGRPAGRPGGGSEGEGADDDVADDDDEDDV